LLGVKLS